VLTSLIRLLCWQEMFGARSACAVRLSMPRMGSWPAFGLVRGLSSSASSGVAPQPYSWLLLGATGRTGKPFLEMALARGHRVTVIVRDANKFAAGRAAAGGVRRLDSDALRVMTGSIGDADLMRRAIVSSRPSVILSMLASDPKPHNAVSSGTRAVLAALDSEEVESDPPLPQPPHWIAIHGQCRTDCPLLVPAPPVLADAPLLPSHSLCCSVGP
jgi:hypothetical protein